MRWACQMLALTWVGVVAAGCPCGEEMCSSWAEADTSYEFKVLAEAPDLGRRAECSDDFGPAVGDVLEVRIERGELREGEEWTCGNDCYTAVIYFEDISGVEVLERLDREPGQFDDAFRVRASVGPEGDVGTYTIMVERAGPDDPPETDFRLATEYEPAQPGNINRPHCERRWSVSYEVAGGASN